MADAEAPLTILYFAWLRERTGTSQENVTPPAGVRHGRRLIAWLAERSPGHASAFANRRTVRCAVNQDFADPADAGRPRRRGGILPAGDRRLTAWPRISVQTEDFDIGAEFAALTAGRTDIGGIGCFVGTVRSNAQDRGRGDDAGALSGDDRARHRAHHRGGRTALGRCSAAR